MDIGAWLRDLGLSQYAASFRDRAIEQKDLEWLDDAELKRMGVAPRHRKQILAAIGALNPLLDEDRAISAGAEGARALGLNAQKRRMTVMFCDLVGSTQLATQMDAEALREVIGRFHSVCADAVAQASGFVAQYLGDGIMAFFGYPAAHEDDAERAVLTGIAIVDAVARMREPRGGPLAVRVGIATGSVIVGDVRRTLDRRERAIVGETPNLASRLQSLATANQILIADSTHNSLGELFECKRRDALRIKGIAGPVTAWEVVGEAAAGDPRRRETARAQPPLSGRTEELARLLDLWRRHVDGEPQSLGLIGEAGIGKTRLLRELRARIAGTPHVWLESAGAQVFRSRPFFPVVRMIRRSLARDRKLSAREYLNALTASLESAGLDPATTTPLIAELIDVPTADTTAPVTASQEQRRARLVEALSAWIAGIAARFPTALVLEDVHWADASTLELLERLIASGAGGGRPFVIYTSRDASAISAPASDNHVQIMLQPLDDNSLREVISNTAPEGLRSEFMDSAVERAQGIPLYAVELALFLDKQRLHDETVPQSLSALLNERLDRLGAAREVALIASVLGNDFWFRLLHLLAGGDARQLRASVSRLVDAGVLAAQGARQETRYAFRHALLRDAAYGALLRSQRRELHRRAAVALSEEYPQFAAMQPQLMAQHWTGAAEPARALAAWRLGGDHARRARAFREAEEAYLQALQVLEQLPVTSERDAEELAIQNGLTSIYQITKGYSAAATAMAASRAHALATRAGDIAAQMAQEVVAWTAQSSAGEYQAAALTAARAMQLARADGRPSMLAHGFMIQMTSHYRLGDLIGAEESFAGGRPFFDTPGFCRQPGAFAQTFGNAARVAWMMDDHGTASMRMQRALQNAERCDNPYDLAFAHYMNAILHVLMGELAGACAAAERSIALSEANGFPQFAAISRVALGRARTGLDGAAEAEACIRQGIEAMTLTRSRVAMTMYLTWLAEAQMAAGDSAGARTTLDEALRFNPQELFFRPETLRLRAIARAGAEPDLARQDIQEAVSLAKRMGAKLFHARALATPTGR
jgi:class 3 adenylate cyclase/tetratricopeptide (TPR) repeat protein